MVLSVKRYKTIGFSCLSVLEEILDEDGDKFPVSDFYNIYRGKTLQKNDDWFSAIVLLENPKSQTNPRLILYNWKWKEKENKWSQKHKYQFTEDSEVDDIVTSLIEFCGTTNIENMIDVDDHIGQTIEHLRAELQKKEQEQEKIVEERVKQREKELKDKVDELGEKIGEYSEMLEEDLGEQEYQEFLEDNYWFFGPEYFDVERENPAGYGGRIDFLLKRTDGFHDIVETKKPDHELFTGSDTLSAKLKDTLSQIADYLDFYETNRLHHREQTGNDVYQPKGIIVIGRRNEDTQEAIKKHERVIHPNIEILTYDDLKERAEQTIETLKEE